MLRKAAVLLCLLLGSHAPLPAQALQVETILARPQDLVGGGKAWSRFKRLLFGVEDPQEVWMQPMGVAMDGRRMAVVDAGAGVVWLADRISKRLERLAPPEGWGTPIDIVLQGAQAFISDSAGGKIWNYDLDRRRWTALSPRFVRPTGLGGSRTPGLLYVIDTGGHALYSWDGTTARAIAREGLNFPTDVCELDGECLVIADSLDHQVELWSPDGKRLGAFGEAGDARGYFSFIRGVAVDDQQHILVSDVRQGLIQAFSRDGVFLTAFGAARELNHPSYICFDKGTLWVTDSFSPRVVGLRLQP